MPKDPRLQHIPLLLRIAPYIACLNGGGVLFMLFLGLSSIGTFTIDRKIVSGEEFVSRAVAPVIALSLVCFVIAFSLWRELSWSRHLLILCLILAVAGKLWFGTAERYPFEFGPFTVDLPFPPDIFTVLFAGWYLYAKSNVRAYYRELKASRNDPSHEPSYQR